MGFLEQITVEDEGEDQVDHNVLAVPVGEAAVLDPSIESELREFVEHVFDHVEGKVLTTGTLLDAQAAIDFINASLD